MAEAKLIPPSREEARQLLFALRYEAKKAVKADMKGRGLKLWDIESKTITTEAVVYLRNDWRVLLPKAQNGRPRNQRLRRCKCRCKIDRLICTGLVRWSDANGRVIGSRPLCGR